MWIFQVSFLRVVHAFQFFQQEQTVKIDKIKNAKLLLRLTLR